MSAEMKRRAIVKYIREYVIKMSIMTEEIISCPECDTENSVILWSTINVKISPEAREALLDGKINIIACNGCDKEILVERSLLYHDMDNEFCVWYFPYPMTLLDRSFLDQFNKNGEYNLKSTETYTEGHASYFNHIHYVFSMDEMVRYIRFREKLTQRTSI